MKPTHLVWIAGPLLFAGIAYVAATGQIRRLWSPEPADPMIEYPASLDLGEHEVGDQVIFSYAIINRGGRELVIEQVRSNCSCTGMERVESGQYSRVDSLHLKPGEMLNVIEFQTN